MQTYGTVRAETLAWNVQRRDAHGALMLERRSACMHDANFVHIRPRLAIGVVRRQYPPRPRLQEHLLNASEPHLPTFMPRRYLSEDNLGAVQRQLL